LVYICLEMGGENQRENQILDTILKQLIRSDDVYNSVDEQLRLLGIIIPEDQLNGYLCTLQKGKFIEERYNPGRDGQKTPCTPRQHKITSKGAAFIKKNSFLKLGIEKEKRRKKEEHLLKLRIFRTWIWILISVPSVLYVLDRIIFKIYHVDLLKIIVTFVKKTVFQ